MTINKLFQNKQFNWNILDQMIVSGSNFLNIIIIARILGLDLFGEFSVLWLFILFVNSLHMATIIFPMMSLVPRQKELKEYFSGLYKLQFIFILISLVCTVLFLYIYYVLTKQVIDVELLISFSLVLVSYHMQDFYRKYFLVLQKYFEAFLLDILSYITRVIIFLGILFFEINISLSGVFMVFAITYILGILYAVKRYKYTSKISSLKNVYVQHWKLSKWLIPSGVMQWSSINLYIITASVILGPVSVGIIRLAQNIIGALNVVLLAIENYLPTQFSTILEKNGLKALESYVKKVIVSGVLGLSGLGLILSLFSDKLLEFLYGTEYSSYGYIVTWYSFIFVLMFLIVPLRGLLRTLNETKVWFKAYLITSAFSLMIFYPLEITFGINGVMLGILLSHLVLISVSSYEIIQIKKVRYAEK